MFYWKKLIFSSRSTGHSAAAVGERLALSVMGAGCSLLLAAILAPLSSVVPGVPHAAAIVAIVVVLSLLGSLLVIWFRPRHSIGEKKAFVYRLLGFPLMAFGVLNLLISDDGRAAATGVVCIGVILVVAAARGKHGSDK